MHIISPPQWNFSIIIVSQKKITVSLKKKSSFQLILLNPPKGNCCLNEPSCNVCLIDELKMSKGQRYSVCMLSSWRKNRIIWNHPNMHVWANSRCANQFYLRIQFIPSKFFPFADAGLVLVLLYLIYISTVLLTLARQETGSSVYRDVIAPHIIVV